MSEVHADTAHCEETHAMRSFHKSLVDKIFCLLFFSIKNKAAHLCEMLERFLTIIVMRASAPESLLIQLNLFDFCTTIYHSTHTRVAQWQGFQPHSGRFIIP